MPSRRRKRLIRALLGGAVLVAVLAPATSNAEWTPYRRYTFHGAGVVAGKFQIQARASGGRQDNPTLKAMDPFGCFTKKRGETLGEQIQSIIDGITGRPSSAHAGGICRHIGYGGVTIYKGGEVIQVRNACMELRRGVLGLAGPDQNGKRMYVKLVDSPNGDQAGFARTGGVVQMDTLCGANGIPTYPLTAGGFVSTDTGNFDPGV